jgi:transcriptional regulator with XRE-family HTH domain
MSGEKAQGTEADRRLASNVRDLRERQGLSQAGLARRMSERGHPWHQSTVGRVESGIQLVRFGEASDLAAVLGTTMARLTWSSEEASTVFLLGRSVDTARKAHDAIVERTGVLLTAQDSLRKQLAGIEGRPYQDSETIRQAAREARDALGLSPEDAVGLGYREHDEDSNPEDEVTDDGDTEGEPGLVDQRDA